MHYTSDSLLLNFLDLTYEIGTREMFFALNLESTTKHRTKYYIHTVAYDIVSRRFHDLMRQLFVWN